MDTVADVRMAIMLAQQGGAGIHHRFMSVQRQADSVRKVKRAENTVGEEPLQMWTAVP